MGRRMMVNAALAAALVMLLAGCQATTAGGFTRAGARTDAAQWTKQAVAAAGSPTPTSTTRTDGFETCRSDHSYFASTSQWRTITNIAMPTARQSAATAAIVQSFEKHDWSASRESGFVTLTGPKGAKSKGLITVQSGGSAALAVTVTSPCYK